MGGGASKEQQDETNKKLRELIALQEASNLRNSHEAMYSDRKATVNRNSHDKEVTQNSNGFPWLASTQPQSELGSAPSCSSSSASSASTAGAGGGTGKRPGGDTRTSSSLLQSARTGSPQPRLLLLPHHLHPRPLLRPGDHPFWTVGHSNGMDRRAPKDPKWCPVWPRFPVSRIPALSVSRSTEPIEWHLVPTAAPNMLWLHVQGPSGIVPVRRAVKRSKVNLQDQHSGRLSRRVREAGPDPGKANRDHPLVSSPQRHQRQGRARPQIYEENEF